MRVFVLAVVLVVAFAATASAQQPQDTNTPAPTAHVFSKASIDRAVASAINTAPKPFAAAKAPAAPKHQKKNFFKTPWPYLIGAGVAAAVLIAVYSGDGTTGGPY